MVFKSTYLNFFYFVSLPNQLVDRYHASIIFIKDPLNKSRSEIKFHRISYYLEP